MKRLIPFFMIASAIMLAGNTAQSFADEWLTAGIATIPAVALPADPTVAVATMNPANLGSGISAITKVASEGTMTTTLTRMATMRSTLGYIPVGSGDASSTNALRSPGFWATAYGTWGDQDEIDHVFGYEYDVTGFMLGYDVQSSSNWLYGINMGFSFAGVDSGATTDTDVDTFNVGLYASYTQGLMYIDYGVMFSHGEIDNDRKIFTSSGWIGASSKTNSSAYTGYLEIGQHYPSSNYIITPFAGVMYTYAQIEDYGEEAPDFTAVGLLVDETDAEFFSTTLGVKGEYFVDNIFHLKGLVSWKYEHSDDLQSTTEARFNYAGSRYFESDGIDVDKDLFTVGVGMKYLYSPVIVFDLDYLLELADEFDSHTAALTIQYTF